MPQTMRERLKAAQDHIATLRDDRATAVQERDALKGTVEASDVDFGELVKTDEFKNAQAAVKKVGEIDDALNTAREAERDILAMLGEGAGSPASDNGPQDGIAGALGALWNGDALVAEHADMLAEWANSGGQQGKVKLGQIATPDQFAAMLKATSGPMAADIGSDTAGVGGLIPREQRGLIERPQRPLRFLDLLPITQTDSNLIELVQEIPTAVSAAEVAEGDLKPEETITLQDAEFPVRTIAAWVKVRRQALEDAARLRSYLNQRLPYKVMRRVESQAIAGNGVAPNLRGILNTTGIASYQRATAAESKADALLKAMTLLILADYDPRFAALNPVDWEGIRLSRENADGSGAYLFGAPSQAIGSTIWGLVPLATPAIAAGGALVGDENGAEFAVRSGVNVYVSDSDGDDFRRNRITILAEVRGALPVEAPAAFAEVDFTPAA